MEEQSQPLPSAEELIDAFIHPPLVIPLGVRKTEGPQVVVLSAVELWPWRTVLRGVFANRAFEPGVALGPVVPSAQAVDGPVGGAVMWTAQHWDAHANVEWMRGFGITDDVGTEYRASQWSGGPWPPDDELWTDLEWCFNTAVPSTATRLLIVGPVVGSIELDLPR